MFILVYYKMTWFGIFRIISFSENVVVGTREEGNGVEILFKQLLLFKRS